ncbi:MAG: hypothetical protein JRL30_28510 [Deltaproteobacteria bacterium]|nr:hypothetical protein [Deltaproteobacteria bacterium]
MKCKTRVNYYLAGKPGQQTEPDEISERIIESLVRRDRLGNNICEVLALGPKCGTRRMVNPLKVGDFVALPERAATLYRGMCGSDNLVMIDEEDIILYYLPEGVDG